MSIARDANYAGLLEVPILRRLSVSALIYKLQDIKLDYPPVKAINTLIYQARIVTEIQRELQRRQDMPAAPVNTNLFVAI